MRYSDYAGSLEGLNLEEDEDIKSKLDRSYEAIKDVFKRKENLILASSAIAAHFIGDLTGLYDSVPQYDTFTHLLSAGAIAKGSSDFFNGVDSPKLKKNVPYLVLGLGVVWEVYEAAAGVGDSLGDSSMCSLDALKNTGKDLMNNFLGAEFATGCNFLNSIYYSGLDTMAKMDRIKYNIFGF